MRYKAAKLEIREAVRQGPSEASFYEQREHTEPGATLADRCFAAMVRHTARQKAGPLQTETEGAGVISPDLDEETLRGNPEVAWGAREVAAVMMGISRDASLNSTRRRRVFCMYEKYVKACAEAKERKRPPPPNPLGWIILPECNRIILCVRTYRAFIASQLNGGGHGE